MIEPTTQTPAAAPTTPAAPAPSFVQRRSAQEGPGPAPQPRWQDGKTRESRAVKAYELADKERLEAARQQHGDPKPAATADDSAKVTIGKYQFSEAEIGELISTKATHDSRMATLPAKPDDYKVELPVDFKLPQGVEFKFDDKNPLLAQARAFAHRYQLPQAAFSELLALDSAQKIEAAQLLDRARAAESSKLGATGQARVSAVEVFLRGQLGDELARAMGPMIVTSDIVRGFEVLMSRFTSQGAGAFSQAHRVPPDEAGKIAGYETMSFAQRRAAQDAMNQRRR